MNQRNPLIPFPIANATTLWSNAHAPGEMEDDGQTGSRKPVLRQVHLSECTVHLSAEFVASLQSADFLDGNKLHGTLRGFDHDYVKFTQSGSKQVLYIPKAAILYMSGEEPFFRY